MRGEVSFLQSSPEPRSSTSLSALVPYLVHCSRPASAPPNRSRVVRRSRRSGARQAQAQSFSNCQLQFRAAARPWTAAFHSLGDCKDCIIC